jgi:hypothetical protein
MKFQARQTPCSEPRMYPPCLVMPISGVTVGLHRSTGILCVLVALIRTQAERTQRMKIQWKFADGTTSEVEVNEEIGNYITASRRAESNLARKERYHCYSLDAIDYEGHIHTVPRKGRRFLKRKI